VYPGQPGGWYFPGAVDDVRIYHRALSATGVQQLGTRTRGLIGYWKLDEQTGTVAADSSGYGRTGTRVNGAVSITGAVDAALALNGVNQYVLVPHTTALDAYPLSVAAWVKFGSTTGRGGIVNKYVIGAYNGYQVFTEGNGTLCAWYFKDRSNGVYDGTACTLKTVGYADDRWHRVVFVVDNAGGRLYVDGVLTASQAWTGLPGPATTTQPLELGVYPGLPGGWYFFGAVDDVRIYNRALSATEVATP